MIYPKLVDRLVEKGMSDRMASIVAHMFVEYQLGHLKQEEALGEIDNKSTLEEIEIVLKKLEFFHADKK